MLQEDRSCHLISTICSYVNANKSLKRIAGMLRIYIIYTSILLVICKTNTTQLISKLNFTQTAQLQGRFQRLRKLPSIATHLHIYFLTSLPQLYSTLTSAL